MKDFKKSDLKTGMIVKTRIGNRYLVLLNCITQEHESEDLLMCDGGLISLKHYKNNLTLPQDNDCDIIKIFIADYDSVDIREKLELIWERKAILELTMQEAINRIGYKFTIKEG